MTNEPEGTDCPSANKLNVIKQRGSKAFLDYVTPMEEAQLLLQKIARFFNTEHPEGYLPWRDVSSEEKMKNRACLEAIRDKIGRSPVLYSG